MWSSVALRLGSFVQPCLPRSEAKCSSFVTNCAHVLKSTGAQSEKAGLLTEYNAVEISQQLYLLLLLFALQSTISQSKLMGSPCSDSGLHNRHILQLFGPCQILRNHLAFRWENPREPQALRSPSVLQPTLFPARAPLSLKPEICNKAPFVPDCFPSQDLRCLVHRPWIKLQNHKLGGKSMYTSIPDREGHLPTPSPAGMHTITAACGKRSRAR